MRLLLVRHAIAESLTDAASDPDRALTPAGRTRFQRDSLPWLERQGMCDRLLYSPWRRARQTAALLRALLVPSAAMEPCEALAAPPDERTLGLLAAERVVAVGHQPWLAQLAVIACFGKGAEDFSERIALRKGGALLLEGEFKPGAMRLMALFSPAQG